MSRARTALETHRETIRQIAARHGASNVRVFGSVARGESDAESDLDLVVDLQPGWGLLDLGALLMDLRDLLEMPVDVVTVPMLKERVREKVLREAVPL